MTRTATALALGPADHGRAVSRAEFEAAHWVEGYRYELIDGRLYVSPVPDLPHDFVVQWLDDQLKQFARRHRQVVNYVTTAARVFVPDRPDDVNAEPDLAAYHNFPRTRPLHDLDWREVSPLLVAEVVSADDPDKDLVRNVALYLRVPSIQEYWILDPRSGRPPTLTVYRRYRRR